jgi:hypothetical protein
MEGVKPTAAQIKALSLLESEAERKELIAGFRPVAAPAPKPRSITPGAVKPPADKNRVESHDAADDLAALRG